MSGICGIIRFDGKPVNKKDIKAMLSIMNNRGCDGQGDWVDDNIGVGHTMLWTTSESQHEKQPLVSSKGSLILTADARVDNRDELIDKLSIKKQHHEILTDGDLILLAYDKWGKGCTEYLIGDFSFALWDIKESRLFCARDHIGIKQFYYYADEKQLVFASTIAAVFAGTELKKEPNIGAIKQYLKDRTIGCEETFFKKIKRLLPSHTLTVKKGVVRFKRYWFPEEICIDNSITFKEAQEKFMLLLQQAVKARLRSAYKIGCELSGGLDSSSILSLATSIAGKENITAFSTLYGGLKCDEERYIREVATNIEVNPIFTNALQLDYTKKYSLAAYYDTSADWPGSGSFLDCRGECEQAKKHGIRVILTGQGGDHVTSGNYLMYADYFITLQWSRLFNELKVCNFSWKTLKNYIIAPILPHSVKKCLRGLLGKGGNSSRSQSVFCLTGQKIKFCSHAQRLESLTLYGAFNLLWVESNPYVRLGGEYNIEYRHPFFDKRVVAFALSLPPQFKMQGHIMKIILRESMKGILPDSVRMRKDKAEFTPIIKHQIDNFRDHPKLNTFSLLKKYGVLINIEKYEINVFWKRYCIEKWLQTNFGE